SDTAKFGGKDNHDGLNATFVALDIEGSAPAELFIVRPGIQVEIISKVETNLNSASQGERTFIVQPSPNESKDIWTTSIYSYAPGGLQPGGGEDDYRLLVGGSYELGRFYS